jgi:hypothetical protein
MELVRRSADGDVTETDAVVGVTVTYNEATSGAEMESSAASVTGAPANTFVKFEEGVDKIMKQIGIRGG